MQLDIKPALVHYDISTTRSAAVQQVRMLIEFDKDATDACSNAELIRKLQPLSPVERAKTLIKDIFGIETTFDNELEAGIVLQALVDNAMKTEGIVEDSDLALMSAQKRFQDFKNKPENRCMFVTGTRPSAETITEQRDFGTEGGAIAVEVNKEGKLKKGQKGAIAEQMYQDWVKTAPNPNDNQAFIQLLIDKLGMTKAGATTYNYNMKKKFGGTITAKPKRAK